MSYTPDDQLFDQEARDAIDSLQIVRERMMNRIASGSWKDEHVQELGVAISAITSLEILFARIGAGR